MIGPRGKTITHYDETFYDLAAAESRENPPAIFAPRDPRSRNQECNRIAQVWDRNLPDMGSLTVNSGITSTRETLSRTERQRIAMHIMSDDHVVGTTNVDTGLGLRKLALELRRR